MKAAHIHTTHPQVANRLKRAGGHLNNVIAMLESDEPCLDIVQQLHAVERAVTAAKKALIHDHLSHCMDDALKSRSAVSLPAAMDEFKLIAKYL